MQECEKKMSKPSHLENNNTTDSEILGSLDSVPLASEPPDIRKLFPSYTYESPELNTLDGFQDFDESGETFFKQVEGAEPSKNRTVGRSRDGLLAVAKRLLDGVVKCSEYDKCEDSKPAAVDTGSSESLSLFSEPPDIKNLFPSFVYESPSLDTTEDFTVSDNKECEDDKVSDVQKHGKQINEDVRDFHVGESTESRCQSEVSAVVVKCTSMIKYSRLSNQSAREQDSHKVYQKPRSCTLRQEKENVLEKVSAGTLDLTAPKENCWRRPIDKSTVKENEGTELVENGFISTRKKTRQEKTGNVTKRSGVEFESLRHVVNSDKDDAKVRRKVFGEISNFQPSNVVEITGKWSCPQKNKPNLGPPLKQLRLEQWVRRT